MSEIRHPNENPESVSPSPEAQKPEAVRPQEDDKQKLQPQTDNKQPTDAGQSGKRRDVGSDSQSRHPDGNLENVSPSSEMKKPETAHPQEDDRQKLEPQADNRQGLESGQSGKKGDASSVSPEVDGNTKLPKGKEIENKGLDDSNLENQKLSANPSAKEMETGKEAPDDNQKLQQGKEGIPEKTNSPEGDKLKSDDWMDPDDRAYLNSLYDSGELVPTVQYSSIEPKEPTKHLPTEKTGSFDDERGNSTFHPNDPKAQEVLRNYGQDGVDYHNGDPDFTPFSTHDSPWGDVDSNVKIGHMTDQRENPSYEYGRRKDAHDPDADLGNFAQADNALAEKLNSENPDRNLNGKDIEDWRKANGLTWHEIPDGESMQLIPADLHDACRHSGGVSEQRYLQAMGNYWPEDLEDY